MDAEIGKWRGKSRGGVGGRGGVKEQGGMEADMENWSEIRRGVLVEGVSRRQILRETGMHWRTLRKMLKHSEPPGYQQSKPRTKKKLEAYVRRIEQILKEDQAMPRKQRH